MRQTKPRIWLGAVLTQMSRSQSYMGMAMSVMTSAAAYKQAREWFPWINFWELLGILFGGYVLMGVLDYVLLTPSQTAYQNDQACKHEHPMMVSLKRIEKHLGIKEE